MFPVRGLHVGVLTIALCSAAVTARAQALEPPPDPASLATPGDARRQSLDATASLVGAYNGLANVADITSRSPQQNGGQYGLQSGIAWGKRTRRTMFTLSDGVAMRYLPTVTSGVSAYHGAAAGMTLQLGRTRIAARQSATISPFYSVVDAVRAFDGTSPDLLASGGADGVALVSERTYSSRLDITQALTRRTSVSLSGRFDDTRFSGQSLRQQDLDAGARITRRIGQSLGAVLGYRQEQVTSSTALSPGRSLTIVRTIDAGFDFRHELRIVRRATVHATSGIAQLQDPALRRRYQLVGNAGVSRQMGRTWYANVDYVRGTTFVRGLPQAPIYSDSGTLSVSGSLSRRVDLLVRTAYTSGRLESIGNGHHTEIGEAAARLRTVMSRKVSSSVEYLFDHYRFDRTDILAVGLPS